MNGYGKCPHGKAKPGSKKGWTLTGIVPKGKKTK
jgi:hypothetical protein